MPPVGSRRRYAEGHSIGRRSRALKNRHLMKRIWRVMLGVVGVVVGAMAIGIVVGGIGFGGLFFTALASILVAALLLRYPRLRVPTRGQLARGPLRSVVGQTELWLEARRRDVPPEARQMIDQIGIQLDSLGLQLDHASDSEPAMADIRKLVGEYLPDIVGSYTAIPAHLRAEPAAGTSPDQALTESLARISSEIESVTRQLASGSIDDLAIKARYLDYRYGDALSGERSPLAGVRQSPPPPLSPAAPPPRRKPD